MPSIFSAKDTLADLFSGVFILDDLPYKIGDYVVIDDTVRGMVTHICIRSTRLLTRKDVAVTIPNSEMGNSKVVNEPGGPQGKFRIRVKVGVGLWIGYRPGLRQPGAPGARFLQEKIEIPYSKQDLYIKERSEMGKSEPFTKYSPSPSPCERVPQKPALQVGLA